MLVGIVLLRAAGPVSTHGGVVIIVCLPLPAHCEEVSISERITCDGLICGEVSRTHPSWEENGEGQRAERGRVMAEDSIKCSC